MDKKTNAEKRREQDMAVQFPGKDIVCKTCAQKKSGILGYRNAYCAAYPYGKPNGILFQDDPCNFYTEEASA